MDDRSSWGTAEDAFRAWVDACEDIGVFVFQSSDVDVAEMRGFVLVDPLAPTITINAKDARSARVFTLLHEFGHILLGEEGISNLVLPPHPRTPEQKIEVFCNALAAEILVPASDLQGRVSSAGAANDLDPMIESLANLYKVSREVIARRLADLEIITRGTYEQKREQYIAEFAQRSKEEPKEYRIRYARMVVRNNGRAFTRLVLNAYGESLITARDVSNLLNAKLRHLPRIEAEAFPLAWMRGAV
jgi:Zn-dependent peptidase ImmA (M78 family)